MSVSLTLSFDDAPTPDSAVMNGKERTTALIAGLKGAGVEEVVFYCNAKPEGFSRLEKYSAAGHALGNHTSSHPDLQKVTAVDFQKAVKEGEEFLRPLAGFRRWFRYPYLREAHKDPAKNKAIKSFLKKENYQLGYITIETYDWYLNDLMQEAHRGGREINDSALEDLYCRMLSETVEEGMAFAQSALGRQPVHVLLLHENDLNARYLPAFIAQARGRGFLFPKASEAFKDPIADAKWDQPAKCMRRLDAIASAAGITTPAPSKWLDEKRIEAEFEALFNLS